VPQGQLAAVRFPRHAGVRDVAANSPEKTSRSSFRRTSMRLSPTPPVAGSTLRIRSSLSTEEPEFARAREFSGKVRDVTEFLASLASSQTEAASLRVTYQDSCHLLHGRNPRSSAHALARHPRSRIVELPGSEICAAPPESTTHANGNVSRIAAEKMLQAQSTRAPIHRNRHPGCLLQLRAESRSTVPINKSSTSSNSSTATMRS